MNTLADCAIARHGDEVSSASITLRPAPTSLIMLALTLDPGALHAEVRDGSGILPVQRSAGREDDGGRGLAIIDVLAGYRTSGRAPGGGRKWVLACMSRGNGLFDEGR